METGAREVLEAAGVVWVTDEGTWWVHAAAARVVARVDA